VEVEAVGSRKFSHHFSSSPSRVLGKVPNNARKTNSYIQAMQNRQMTDFKVSDYLDLVKGRRCWVRKLVRCSIGWLGFDLCSRDTTFDAMQL
jgi:hypothetical protein